MSYCMSGRIRQPKISIVTFALKTPPYDCEGSLSLWWVSITTGCQPRLGSSLILSCFASLYLIQDALSLSTLFFSFIFGRQQLQIKPDPSSGADVAIYREPYFSHDPNTRTEFLPLSCKVTAYPSSGGIILSYFSAVELVYLSLSRTKPANRSLDLAEEELPCGV
jgi:hypothetical protein